MKHSLEVNHLQISMAKQTVSKKKRKKRCSPGLGGTSVLLMGPFKRAAETKHSLLVNDKAVLEGKK